MAENIVLVFILKTQGNEEITVDDWEALRGLTSAGFKYEAKVVVLKPLPPLWVIETLRSLQEESVAENPVHEWWEGVRPEDVSLRKALDKKG